MTGQKTIFQLTDLSTSGSQRAYQYNFGGGASLIHDQLGLVKAGATPEEVLLRRKELATQFEYFTMFGLSFTFGSIYNNVVNPRFGNSRRRHDNNDELICRIKSNVTDVLLVFYLTLFYHI